MNPAVVEEMLEPTDPGPYIPLEERMKDTEPDLNGHAPLAVVPPSEETHPPDRGLDDIGNAARFADQHAGCLLYVPAWKHWLRWDAHRWAEDQELDHLRRARQTARSLAQEALDEDDATRRKDRLKHAAQSSSEPRLRAMLTIAASDKRFVVRPTDLDRDPFALNTWNGVVDLRTGELRAHDRKERVTLVAGAGYAARAQAPQWEATLRRCLVDPENIGYLQRLAGLSAIGQTRSHLLVIFTGGGANGKTVTVNAIAGALNDYAHYSTIGLLLQSGRSAGAATPELADLRGRRLVTVSETPEDGRLAAERVKWITGGEPITARLLHGNPFTFEPSHTVWLSTNHLPRIDDDGHGIWRRIRVVKFPVTIPEDEQDEQLGEKLALERAGILRWIVDGARAYLADGLNEPENVRLATADYRQSEDAFGAFLDEQTVVEEDASAAAAELLKAYSEWATKNGAPTLSRNAFADKLHTHGFERRRVTTGTRWFGLRLDREGTLE